MSYTLGRSAQSSLWRLVAFLAAIGLTGWALGLFWPALAAGLLLASAWHFAKLWGLLRLLTQRRWIPIPDGAGLWAELEGLLNRRQLESRNRKHLLLGMLRAYRQAFAALPDATVVLDRDLRIRWFNDAATPLLGLRQADRGAPFTHLMRSPRLVEWLESRRTDEPLMDVPVPADESKRLSLRLIPYAQGEWLLVARDISKLMHLEQVRRDFVANVSHELRTPLTVIHGYLDLFEPEDNPAMAPAIEEMRRQSQRMAQIVEDLLTLSRLEAQDRPAEATVDLCSQLSMLRREAEALSQGRHTILTEDLCDCDLHGSPKDLHSAFSNLVVNAVRYTPAGGTIVIRTEPRDDGISLSVADTGPGIAAQHLPRITERFYRVSASRSRDSGGTGLGLSIVKHVLNLHQARLEIESEVGKGSTFRCVFARARTTPRDASSGAGA
jgi:two-component system, OmpR family, phosphate regulon sensor histidine kinase PhoR